MKIFTHEYILSPGPDPVRAAPAPGRGALLKFVFEDGETGYADLHPLPAFGHAPLADHLASLPTEHPTHLARISLRHARTDAAARRAGASLFDGLPEVRSHALFTGWTGAPRETFEACLTSGYEAVKLKIGKNPPRETAALNRLAALPVRWRLDANASFRSGGETIGTFLSGLSSDVRRNIEFLEDPCPYSPDDWLALSREGSVTLALDWQLPASAAPWPGAGVVVIKPASQEAFPLALAAAHAGNEIVVTHSMDHPLGQSVALWTAMRLRQRHGDLVRDGGLQACGLHAPDDFTTLWRNNGPVPPPPCGTGFGFDGLLGRLPWTPL